MTFRDHGYKQALSGTMAPAHHSRLKDTLDDSLQSYLQPGSWRPLSSLKP